MADEFAIGGISVKAEARSNDDTRVSVKGGLEDERVAVLALLNRKIESYLYGMSGGADGQLFSTSGIGFSDSPKPLLEYKHVTAACAELAREYPTAEALDAKYLEPARQRATESKAAQDAQQRWQKKLSGPGREVRPYFDAAMAFLAEQKYPPLNQRQQEILLERLIETKKRNPSQRKQ